MQNSAPGAENHKRNELPVLTRAVTIVSLICLIGLSPGPAGVSGQSYYHHTTIQPDSALVRQIKNPTGIAIQQPDIFYIADRDANRILKVNKAGTVLDRRGRFGWEPEEFDYPSDLVLAQNLNLYVADYNNARVQHFDREMNFVRVIPLEFSGLERAPYPGSVARSPGGWIYVLDDEGHQILQLRPDGSLAKVFGGFSELGNQLRNAFQLRVDGSDHLYILGNDPARIYIFDRFGTYVTSVGHPEMQTPAGMTSLRRGVFVVTRNGALFHVLMDTGIRRITLTGPDMEGVPVDVGLKGDFLYILTRNPLRIEVYRPQSRREK